jgi:hypothetical protein
VVDECMQIPDDDCVFRSFRCHSFVFLAAPLQTPLASATTSNLASIGLRPVYVKQPEAPVFCYQFLWCTYLGYFATLSRDHFWLWMSKMPKQCTNTIDSLFRCSIRNLLHYRDRQRRHCQVSEGVAPLSLDQVVALAPL